MLLKGQLAMRGRVRGGARGGVRGVMVILAILLGGGAAWGQVSQLDKTTLIEGLADEGMGQLLLHWSKTQPSDDPVVMAQIQIARYRIESADPGLDLPARLAALKQTLEAMRQLIATSYDHEQRPLWQTDLAQWLLFTDLEDLHQKAWEFYTFGVPTKAQKQAYQEAVVEALEAAGDADLRFFQLQGLLPRQADHLARRVNTGLWTRMIEEYWKKRTAYCLALAAVSVARLPEDADYFQHLGHDDKIPSQASTWEAERIGLAQLALAKLKPFLEDLSDQAGLRDRARVLAGLAYNLLDQPDQALAQLNPVIEAAAGDLTDWKAHLARAEAWQLQQKTTLALEDLQQQEQHHPAVQNNIMNRLLGVDQRFRLRLHQARTAEQVAQAYGVYTTLLSDPTLGDQLPWLRDYIAVRWSENLDPATDLATVPAVVRVAIGQVARQEGQQAQDAGVVILAQNQFQRAILVNESLLTGGADAAVLAPAKFNLALALYGLNPDDVSNLMRVADLLVDVADTMSDQPVADDAMSLGIDLLQKLHQATPRPAGVDQAYRHGAAVLFARYPLTQAADDQRLYYGYAIEQQAGHYQAAIDQYERVPEDHPTYFDAQRERLLSMAALSQAGEKPWNQAVVAAEQVRREASGALASGRRSATSALAGASLVLAEARAAAGFSEQALKELAGFEKRFAEDPDLVRLAYEKRLVLLIGVGRYDQAAEQARAMMSAFPDAAAGVIDRVLTQLEGDITRLHRVAEQNLVASEAKASDQQATALAGVAARLAGVLTRWARDQGFDPEQMLAFELIQNKSLRLAGQTDEALAGMGRLIQTFPDDAAVISEYADALFAQGGRARWLQAIPYYDQLIEGLDRPYPDLWWNAWLKRLSISAELGQDTQDIGLRIGQLKRTDPNLGGPDFKRAFEQLQAKCLH